MRKEQVFSPEKERHFSCLIHGSISKFRSEIIRATQIFQQNGIQVVIDLTQEVDSVSDGFIKFKGQKNLDNNIIEGNFLNKLHDSNLSFSYFVNPSGYMGKASSVELDHATNLGVPVFFLEKPDLDFYTAPKNSIWSPEDLTNYIKVYKKIPDQSYDTKVWQELSNPKLVVAAGAIIVWKPKQGNEPQVLLVDDPRWGCYTIIGKRQQRGENDIKKTLIRGVKEETGLKVGDFNLLCAFNQLNNTDIQPRRDMFFCDYIVPTDTRRVSLSGDYRSHADWVSPEEAIRSGKVEPNGLEALKQYILFLEKTA